MKLAEIAEALSGEVSGDTDLEIDRVVHPADAADRGDLAVALSDDALAALGDCKAGAAVVAEGSAESVAGLPVIHVAGDERSVIADLTELFAAAPSLDKGVHESANVAADADIGSQVSIGAFASIGAGSRLGDRTSVLANVIVGTGVVIGSDCTIFPGAVIGDRVEIGDRVIIHANVVIGADGFSFIPAGAPDAGGGAPGIPRRIHSLGTVVVEDDVEIGAGTTIDRATLRQTRIGRATKIDNQVQIAHNTVIGESCIICGKVGIAGSVVLGDRVLVAAAAGIRDHVTIGSDSTIAALAGVGGNVASGTVMSGIPATPHKRWMERLVNVGRLKMLYSRVAALAERMTVLEKKMGLEQPGQAEPTGGEHGRSG